MIVNVNVYVNVSIIYIHTQPLVHFPALSFAWRIACQTRFIFYRNNPDPDAVMKTLLQYFIVLISDAKLHHYLSITDLSQYFDMYYHHPLTYLIFVFFSFINVELNLMQNNIYLSIASLVKEHDILARLWWSDISQIKKWTKMSHFVFYGRKLGGKRRVDRFAALYSISIYECM